MKLAEHPEWDDLAIDELIARADRQEQIEAATSRFRNAVERRSESRDRVYTIVEAPRRGGRKPSSLTRRPHKGSQEWQDWCRSRNACYGCGEQGHAARDCPQAEAAESKPMKSQSQFPISTRKTLEPFPLSVPRSKPFSITFHILLPPKTSESTEIEFRKLTGNANSAKPPYLAVGPGGLCQKLARIELDSTLIGSHSPI